MKQKILLTIAAALVVCIISGCSPKTPEVENKNTNSEAMEENAEVVEIMELKKETIARTIEHTSTLAAYKETHLAPASPGKIEEIFVEIGARVSSGDPLVQMDKTQLHQAKIQLKSVETDFKRLDTLQKVGSISEQQYDQIKTQYEIAKTNVAFLEENTRLLSPFNGIISGKYYEDGEMFSGAPNTMAGKSAIVSIVQIDPLKAMFSISETYFPQVKEGMTARVLCDIYPGKEFTGDIFRIHPTIDPSTRSFQAELKISNQNEMLRPGMFCRVILELGEEEALVVPAIAVLKLQGTNERYVFIEENGKAKRITVKPGKRFDDKIEILTTGLIEGSHLIVTGQSRLLDGDEVSVVNK